MRRAIIAWICEHCEHVANQTCSSSERDAKYQVKQQPNIIQYNKHSYDFFEYSADGWKKLHESRTDNRYTLVTGKRKKCLPLTNSS